MNEIERAILRYFNIRNKNNLDYLPVKCPYHNDKNPSAILYLKTKTFNCFAGCGYKTFQQIYEELINEGQVMPDKKVGENFLLNLQQSLNKETGRNIAVLKDIESNECINILNAFISSRCISIDTYRKVGAIPILEKDNTLFGRIQFPINGNSFVARKFLPDDILAGERYLNSNGEKPLYGTFKDNQNDYILVEGIFDYLSLLELGYENVIANLGTEFNQRRAFPFRNKVVNIIFDNDYAGYMGTQKAYKAIKEIGGYPIILDLPKVFGNDINDAYKNHKETFTAWIHRVTRKTETDDTGFMETFDSEDNLYTLKTGLKELNRILKGGYKVGLHVKAAEPGVGKSALCLFLTKEMVELNKNCKALYCTYEIPKTQCWARLLSIYDENPWADIETNTGIIQPETKLKGIELAKKIKIVAGWDISQIIRVSNEYNLIIIDYIQRMPGDMIDGKPSISRNLSELSRLAIEKEKIIIIVSSIPRMGYGKEDLSIFKGEGDIEFSAQSAMLLKDINKGGEDRMLSIVVLKNTRGPVGVNFWLKGNMLHNKFEEILGE